MKRIFIIILIALSFIACKTHKTAVIEQKSEICEEVIKDVSSHMEAQHTDSVFDKWMADSTVINITADSIVTPEGVIYKPKITIKNHSPTIEKTIVAKTDSIAHTEFRSDSISHINATYNEQTESSTEATPISDTLKYLAILFFMILVFGLIKWLSRKN